MVAPLRSLFRGRYQLVGTLSTSSAHQVFLAEDLRRSQQCALKLSPAPTPRRMAQARREYEILRHLRHPAIAEVLDFGQASAEEVYAAGLVPASAVLASGAGDAPGPERGTPPADEGRGGAARFAYLASAYHRGLDLRDAFLSLPGASAPPALPATGSERWPAFLEALAIVCDALHAVHAHGLIHFDIKPENLLLIPDRDGEGPVHFRVKILDFGLSEADTTPLFDGVRGTVPYLAPEILRAESADRRSDLFSLGVTIAYAVWGRYPFAGSTPSRWLASARDGRFVPLERLRPAAPAGLVELVRRLCDPDPDRRPVDALEVRAALERIGGFCLRRGQQILTRALPRVAWQQPLGLVSASLDALRRGQSSRQPLVLVSASADQFPEPMVDEIVSNARADGVPVYRGTRASPVRWPYQPLAEIVTQIAADVDLAAPRFARFAGALASFAPAGLPPTGELPPLALCDARDRFVDLITDFFLELARDDPLLLCFCGLHDFSLEELLVIETLARKAQLASARDEEWLRHAPDDPARLLIVATCASEDAEPSDEPAREEVGSALAELTRQSFAVHVRLPLLDKAGAQEWLRERAPHFRPSGELLRLLLEKSAGRPRLLDEFVRRVVDRDAPHEGLDRLDDGVTPELLLSLPRQSEEALLERAALVPPDERRLLEVLAVASSGLSAEELAAAESLPRANGATAQESAPPPPPARAAIDTVVERARRLEDAGLAIIADTGMANEIRIAESALAQRLYQQIPADQRAQIHRTLATLLHAGARTAPPCRAPVDVAYHAARAGDLALQAEQLLIAADRHLAACAPEACTAHYEEFLAATEEVRFASRSAARALLATRRRFAIESFLAPAVPETLGIADLRLRVHARLAELYLEQAQSTRALENLAILASLLADRGDALPRAAVCRRMGEAYRLVDEPANALHFLERARKFLSDALGAETEPRRGRTKPAFRSTAAEIARGAAHEPAVVELLKSLRGLARIRLERDELAQAERLLRECMELAGTSPAYRSELCRTCLDQAEVDKRTGNHVSRSRFAGEALEHARAANDSALVADALAAVGAADIARGEYDEAVAVFQERLRVAESLDSKAELSQCYSSLGMIHHNRSNYGAALECYQKALYLKRATGEKRGIANAFNNLGLVYELHDDYRLAADCFRRAIDLFTRINDAHGIAAGMNNLSGLLELEGRYDEALDYSFRALDRRRKLRSRSGIAYCLYRIGKIYRARGELEKAASYADKALAIRQDLGEKLSLSYSQVQVADLLLAQGQYRDATRLCEEAHASFAELENDVGILVSREARARILLAIGEIAESRTVMLDVLQRAVGLQQHMLEGGALLTLGHVAAEEGGFDEASRRYLEAERLFRLHQSPRHLAEALLARAALALEQRRPSEALALLEEAYSLLERLGIRDLVPLYFLLRSRGETERSDGNLDVAVKFLERALVETRELTLPDLCWRCHHGLAILAARTGDARLAKLHLEQAREVLDSLYAALPAGSRRAFYRLRERATFQRTSVRGAVLIPEAGSGAEDGQAAELARPPEDAPPPAGGAGDAASEGAASRAEVLSLARQTLKLHDIACAMGTEPDLQRLLECVMEAALEFAPAERGFLLLRSPGGSETTFPFARNVAHEAIVEPRDKVSASIAARVLRTGEPVLTGDALAEQPFSTTKSIQEMRLRSILCVPMKFRGAVLGAIYVDNRLRKNAFRPEDVNVLQALADQAAVAVTNARLIEDNQRRTAELEEANRQMDALNLKLRRKVQARTAQLAIAREDLRARQSQLEERYSMQNLVGESEAMQRVFELVERVAPTSLPVILQGESGTGKELVARAIHFASPWKEARFVTENCAGLTETLLESEIFGHDEGAFTGAVRAKKGLFEIAHGGTLFLDEVADMPDAMQQRLLRVIEEGSVRRLGSREGRPARVRVIAASNEDVRDIVERGRFRSDLYYRLNGLTITLPPLRDRKEDIPILAQHFLHELSLRTEGSPFVLKADGLRYLLAQDWPGNVRELRHALERAALISVDRSIGRECLEPRPELSASAEREATRPPSTAQTLRDARCGFERRFLAEILAQCSGNVSLAARTSGISRETFYRLLRKHGIRTD